MTVRRDSAGAAVGRDDLRAAVAAGMISEAQAASLVALAEARAGVRAHMAGHDEPFELFRGFNEIFIVVGLVILYSGWAALTGLSVATGMMPGLEVAAFAALTLGALWLLARYFTLRRRMVAPSIALTVMAGLAAVQLGLVAGWELGLNWQGRLAVAGAVATAILALWYAAFRVPFTVALIALGVFATSGLALVSGGAEMPDWRELFILTGEGPFAWLTVVLGLIALTLALSFDMSDPHRVTRRAAAGFWLHVVSAPAIVNSVALTLLEEEALAAQLLLVAFLCLLALVSVVIDRRSFLVAGAGYMVTLAFLLLQDWGAAAIVLMGLGLVLLGAQWERLRCAVMRALPRFPGKTRLPPWDLIDAKETA
jgi:hypothetical protein